MASTTPLQAAGKVDIHELSIISGEGEQYNLFSYMLELNLFEDIYSSGLYGNIVISDSVGLIRKLKLIGEEYITIKFDTPSFNDPIYKTFRCCGISNREFVRDTITEKYIIHFVSPEVFLDHYIPVQRSFSGNADDIVAEIYQKYLWHPRKLIVKDGVVTDSEDNTELCIYSECKTPVKFISPSWTPMKCIGWLSSKVTPTVDDLQGANYMFFESSKKFYWGSIENMVKDQLEKETIFGIYTYAPGNVKTDITSVSLGGVKYKSPDIQRDYFSIHDLNIITNVDVLQNIQTGYLASVYHELDISKKEYKEIEYDHVIRFPDFKHMQQNAFGFFADNSVRTPYAHQIVGFKQTGLFTDFNNNLNEFASTVKPIRNSMMAELNQIKMKITIHGRSDAEVGSLLYLVYPKNGEKTENDTSHSIDDPFYSGLYLITAIHHRITFDNHEMICEIVKDSYGDVNEGKGGNE